MKFYNYLRNIRITGVILLALSFSSFLKGQAASSLFPDITEFKVEFPLDDNGNDYEGVSYNDRDDPHIKNAIAENLGGYVAPSPYNQYFFVSGSELVMRSHCAGALTSVNAYPRCELRQQINGNDSFWDFSDEHEINVTFRIMELPNEKQEVCVVQIKGTDTPNTTDGTEEVLRVEYRGDGSSGWHLEVNESSGPSNVLSYNVGQTVHIRAYVNNGHVYLEMENLSNGSTYDYDYDVDSDYTHGYFKAGAYTQSSIWKEKNGTGTDEDPDARSEVRFSQIELGESNSNGGNTCTAEAPANRNVNNVSQSTATLSWNSVANVENYDVRWKSTSSSSWTYNTNYTSTSLNISGLSDNTQYEWQVKSTCPDGSDTNYSQGPGPNFTTSSNNGGGTTFTPDPNKNYYIDNPTNNKRLAATGSSEDAYTTTTSTTGSNVEWKFVAKGNGYWHVQRAAGGTKPRLRTDNSINADMQATSSSGTFTYYEFAEGANSGTWFMTLPSGPSNYKRLRVNSGGDVKFASTSSAGGDESFKFTEVNSSGSFTPNPNANYYIDAPHHNLRIAATGSSESGYTTSTNTTGSNVEWKFVAKGNGSWHVQRAAGGTKPRLRSNNSSNADMQSTGSVGGWTYYDFEEGAINGTWFMTLPDGPSSFKRLQVNNSGQLKMVSTGSAGTWESFTFTEVGNSGRVVNSDNTNSEVITSVLEPDDSDNTSIEEDAGEWGIYPNPAANEITIEGLPEGEKIQVFNMNGQLVLETVDRTISIAHLQSGIYFVRSLDKPIKRFIKL